MIFSTIVDELAKCTDKSNTEIVNLLLKPVLSSEISEEKAQFIISEGIPYKIREALIMYPLTDMENYIRKSIMPLIKSDISATLRNLIKEEYESYPIQNNVAKLITDALYIVMPKENHGLIHTAPVITPWPDMPDFSNYLTQMRERFSSIRTLLYHDEPKPFYDFYVCNHVNNLNFNTSVRRYNIRKLMRIKASRNISLSSLTELCNYIIITGTGGIGKSMIMRHFLLSSIAAFQTKGMIPIFISLKEYSNDDFFDFFYARISNYISKQDIIETLAHNRIQFILDGYDEIRTDCKRIFEKNLKKFINQYPDNSYIISSRPLDNEAVFRNFMIFELKPFTMEQSLELIDKLEFRPDDPSIKAKFAKQIKDSLYRSHKEFVSNPLLLTIMLMTFEQFAEVPSRMHLFYHEAYVTLSQTHDAYKGAYKRPFRTKMSSEQLANYLAEFCTRTYCDEKYEMTERDIEKYLFRIKNVPFSSEDFIYDLQKNLCLLSYEANCYHFVHRSFQEYFCALFFSKQKDKLLAKIGNFFEKKRISYDNTFGLLYDMIPEKVEEYIFLPNLKSFFEKYTGKDAYWNYLVNEIQYFDVNPFFKNVVGYNKIHNYFNYYSFIHYFILDSVIKRKIISKHIEYPKYNEFIEYEYDLYEFPNGRQEFFPIGDTISVISKRYSEATIQKAYSYRFDFTKIAKNKEKYSDLVKIIESDDFQPYIDFFALKNYYEHLISADDDALSFLGK